MNIFLLLNMSCFIYGYVNLNRDPEQLSQCSEEAMKVTSEESWFNSRQG